MNRRIVTAVVVLLGCLAGTPRPARAEQPMDLWLYQATNLQVDANVDGIEKLWKRAAAAGYTHVLLADSKFARLGDLGSMEKVYFRNIDRVKKIAADLHMQIVPALFPVGYSNSMLWHNPNLAEGLPVKDALFVVKGGEARLVADPAVGCKEKFDWKDEGIAIEGGVATVRDNSGNARLVQKVTVAPFRCYHVAVEVRTDNYTGTPEVKPLAGSQCLSYTNLGVQRTQGWKLHHIVFNSLENREVSIYLGVWGGAKGTLQWRNWKVEEAGLVNVLRRPGAPCTVAGLVEGKDYEPIADPRMGNQPWKGEYEVWHEPPVIRTKLPDGTKLRVSWYHPAIIYDEQVSCCPSEPQTMQVLADEAQRMRQAWGAKGYMMSHDEIRTLNWDESCRKRNLDAGAILAENARACTKLLAGSTVYAWSDMFDPFHNAHKDYYLVRGDLAGAWQGLDKSVVIMNWNYGKRDESLKFFADRGHRQIIAGYYDGPVEQVRQWMASAAKVKGVEAIMYTTWRSNYEDLEAFAKAVKGTGK